MALMCTSHVFTDHSAVKAVLETPSLSGKHARRWSKLYGSGVRNVQITYRAGRENANAAALSCCPVGGETADTSVPDVQVAQIKTAGDITELLQKPTSVSDTAVHYSQEQEKDPEIIELSKFLSQGQLPDDSQRAKKIASQAPSFALIDDIVYFIDSKRNHQQCCVVPTQLRVHLMEENHSGPFAGHFSGEKLYKALVQHWYWPFMYSDVVSHYTSLSSVCCGPLLRTVELTPTPSHSCATRVSDCGSRHHGLA